MTRRQNIRDVVQRVLRRILAILFCLFLASVLYLSTRGFPKWLIREFENRINTGTFVFEAGSAKLDLLEGVMMENVRLFKKKTVGPPFVEARSVVIVIDPAGIIGRESLVRKVKIVDCVLRPDMGRSRETAPPEQASSSDATRMHVDLENCTIQGVVFGKVSCRLAADDSGVKLDALEGAVLGGGDPGTFEGRVVYNEQSRILDGHLITRLDPHVFIPMFDANGFTNSTELTGRFEFGNKPPVCYAQFKESLGSNWWFSLEGDFQFQDGRYRGVDVQRADSKIILHLTDSNSLVTIGPMLVVRKEGKADGIIKIDSAKEIVEFDARATMDPKAVAGMIGILTNREMDSWKFEGPVSTAARGTSGFYGYTNLDFTMTMDGYGMGMGPFVSEEASFVMRMTGPTSTFSRIKGKLYGGSFSGEVKLVMPPASGSETDLLYRAEATMKDVGFRNVAKIIGMTEDQGEKSSMSGHVTVEGFTGTGNGRTAVGEGSVRIKDGKLFSMPVFGGLSDVMAKVIPGLDFIMRQTDAKTDFEIKTGKLHTDKFVIEGDVLSLAGDGSYYLDKKLDFDIQVKLMKEHTLVAKLLRALTYPISKLFEFKLNGTVDNPKWYPANFSRDLLKKIGLESKDKDEREPQDKP